MGKPCEDGSRHEKVGRKGSLAALTAAIVAACSPANGEQTKNTPQEVQMAAVERASTNNVTRSQCLAFGTKVEKITCLKQLSAQRKTEIAALDQGLAQDNSEIAAIDTATETEKNTGQQLNTMNVVLSNEVEVLKKLNEITREEFEKGGQDPTR